MFESAQYGSDMAIRNRFVMVSEEENELKVLWAACNFLLLGMSCPSDGKNRNMCPFISLSARIL